MHDEDVSNMAAVGESAIVLNRLQLLRVADGA